LHCLRNRDDAPEASAVSGDVSTTADKRTSDERLWASRYFERQEHAKCGRHAVNTLIGGPQFIDGDLVTASEAVCIETGDPREWHIAEKGWYSLEVLACLFDMTSPPLGQLLLRPCTARFYEAIRAGVQYYGCLVNQCNAHWVCIVPHNGALFYVDSFYTPVSIDLQDFVAILRKYPMTFLFERPSTA
jgi:hypothetical protein